MNILFGQNQSPGAAPTTGPQVTYAAYADRGACAMAGQRVCGGGGGWRYKQKIKRIRELHA